MRKSPVSYDDLIGQRFGQLIVLGIIRAYKQCTRFACRCDCGNEPAPRANDILTHRTTSCGCFKIASQTKHGHTSHGQASTEYQSWRSMMSRCYVPTNRRYARYGGRGITVCAQWQESFPCFLADMGPKPPGVRTIERKDTNGHYEPSNCYWATDAVQARNTSRNQIITFQGITLCLTDWAPRLGLSVSGLRYRLQAWSFQDAMATPAGQNKWTSPISKDLQSSHEE